MNRHSPAPPNWEVHLAIFLVALAIGCLIGFSLAPRAHGGASEPPRIGRLTLPAPWWEIVKQAAQENDLDPCWVMAVMAIESRFYRYCVNTKHRCYGLMQLQADVALGLGVTDPFDPEQNIRAGAKILGRIEREKNGDKRRILKKYNPTDTGAYSREVIKAWKQARRNLND
jgi:soluble lytic murein transglycosylase-like protein